MHRTFTMTARGGVVALAIASALAGAPWGGSAAAAAGACTPGSAATPVASPAAQAPAVPLPTEVAVAAEVNPPGDIPDNQAFVTYASAAGGYSVAMPEGWARQESGTDVTFVDKLHRFTVEITCADAAPTVESAKATATTQLAARVAAFELIEVKTVDLPVGPAVLVRYRMNSAPDEVTGKQIRLDVDRYELFRDGRLAAISLAAPAGSDNVDVSNQVAGSFRWTA